ncbi:MAG: fibronectin type III domain-containing protein [Bacteroidetes bacterium]|nr:MAG: fibronectin type III domain-containing protein [Bacteroidota bacterium]
MPIKFNRCVFCGIFFALLVTAKSFAQVYPVQITNQLIPPYSGYLADYADPVLEKMRVLIQFNDLTQPQYDIRLKLVISGNGFMLSTKATYNPPPVTLTPAIPHLLSGSDLAPYLNSANLDFSGISQQQYEQWQRLPEGFYTICMTAYDYWNPQHQLVSNEACAAAWFTLSDPPLLNFPACNTNVQPLNPQQISFSWTPLHIGSPYSAGTEYDFELYEIRPPNTDPNIVVQNSPPVFTNTTTMTMLNYGITEPALNAGMGYAWRVRARDAGGRDLFRNGGWSTVCSFSYGGVASTLGNTIHLTLQAQATTHRQARCWWNSVSALDHYVLQVRKQGFANWFDYNTVAAEQKVNDLEPASTYEARVKGTGPGNLETNWSDTVTFTTGPEPQFNCNDQTILPDLLQAQPLLLAQPGMIFKIGQHEMTVRTIQSSGPPGWYNGTGYVRAIGPFTMNVTYTNIFVNDNHTITQGALVALSDGIDNWLTQWGTEFECDASYYFNGNIDSVYVDGNGNIVIVDENGNTIMLTENHDGGLLITDSNGDQWIVHDDGTITLVSGGGLLPVITEPLTPDEMDILKKAMRIIRQEFDAAKLQQLTQSLQQAEQSLDQRIQQEKQQLVNSVTPNPSLPDSAFEASEIIVFRGGKISSANVPPPLQVQKNFREAETNYNEGFLLARFSREANSDAELHFIGQYLAVSGKPYKTFVAEEKAKNRTHEAIAGDVALQGIKPLVKVVIRKKMSRG